MKYVILILLISTACKSKANRSLLAKKRDYNGLSLSSKVGNGTETMRLISTDLSLRSEATSLDDKLVRVSISFVNNQSLHVTVAEKGTNNILVSDTITRYMEKPTISSTSGSYQWLVYRKEKFKNARFPTSQLTVTILLMSDYSSFTLRLDSADEQRAKSIEGTAVLDAPSD